MALLAIAKDMNKTLPMHSEAINTCLEMRVRTCIAWTTAYTDVYGNACLLVVQCWKGTDIMAERRRWVSCGLQIQLTRD